MSWIDIFAKVFPVLLLLLLGVYFKQSRFISGQTVNDLKKMVLNVSLPCILFLAFLNTEFKSEHIWIIVIIFLVNILMLFGGIGFQKLLGVQNQYFPFLFTGFEMGMLGIPLFGTVYGMENLSVIGIIDLGHELFIWFILTALLIGVKEKTRNFKKIGQSFITSPVVIGILAGIILNLTGFKQFLSANFLTTGLLNTATFLSQIMIPLILVIIGYQLDFKLSQFSLPSKTILLRMATLLVIALIIIHFVFNQLLKLPHIFSTALLMMFILPPPFIIPLFMDHQSKEQTYVNNTLSLGSIVTIVGFIILMFVYK
jgi:predicted permease